MVPQVCQVLASWMSVAGGEGVYPEEGAQLAQSHPLPPPASWPTKAAAPEAPLLLESVLPTGL